MKDWKKWMLLLIGGLFWGPMGWGQQLDADWIDRLKKEDDWVRWVDAIQRPETVNKLYIKNNDVLDTNTLRTFHHLTGLIVVDSHTDNLDFLRFFPDLTVFECQGNGLKSIEGIDSLKKLTDLSIRSNFVKDISPLRSMSQLKTLSLYENEIETVDPLMDLTNLTHLDLSKNNITHIDSLYWMTDLRFLSLYRCPYLKNIDPVQNFRQLEHLNISALDMPNFSIALLDSITTLRELRVQGMVHSDKEVQNIAHHRELRSLNMGRNDNVTDISPLDSLIHLEYLDIHSNNVSDISIVSSFPRLVKLVAYRNNISDLRPLAECLELKALFIHENPIEDYEPVTGLPGLQHLHIQKSHFTKESAYELRDKLPRAQIQFM